MTENMWPSQVRWQLPLPLSRRTSDMLSMQDRAHRIAEILTGQFSPDQLRVIDESARHAGHAGASAEGQTHYRVEMTSDAFAGLDRVARFRLVNHALAAEFASGLHALSLRLRTRQEAQSEGAQAGGGEQAG